MVTMNTYYIRAEDGWTVSSHLTMEEAIKFAESQNVGKVIEIRIATDEEIIRYMSDFLMQSIQMEINALAKFAKDQDKLARDKLN